VVRVGDGVGDVLDKFQWIHVKLTRKFQLTHEELTHMYQWIDEMMGFEMVMEELLKLNLEIMNELELLNMYVLLQKFQ